MYSHWDHMTTHQLQAIGITFIIICIALFFIALVWD